jgi:hypothetical protein
MPDPPRQASPDKASVAVIKGSPEFQAWFNRFRDHTRLPAALLLDAALVAYAKSIGFEEPPPR